MAQPFPLILASQSPRRRQILESVGLSATILIPDVTELVSPEDIYTESITLQNSRIKAEAVRNLVSDENVIILSADTLVVLGKEVLGKPTSKDDARIMLQQLSGKTHQVVTALVLTSQRFGVFESTTRSSVTFFPLPPEQIENYLSTKEPYDKAGSYAIQGLGALLIEKIEGSYTNIMGLPVETLLQGLEKITGTPIYDWFK